MDKQNHKCHVSAPTLAEHLSKHNEDQFRIDKDGDRHREFGRKTDVYKERGNK